MPGGYKNINGHDGNTFASNNQPKNRKVSSKPLKELLLKELSKKEEIIVSGFDVVTGKFHKIRVSMPTKRMIIAALCRKAARGDNVAIGIVFDRIDGKVSQHTDFGQDDITITINGKPPNGQY
ncbi:MAG: hypothetical protein ABI863_00485 [Ginsengibacter sp.]